MNLSSESAYLCIVDLIQNNPQIATLELNHTQLSDVAGQAICQALMKNTHLKTIDVAGNPYLSQATIDRMNRLLLLPPEERGKNFSTLPLPPSAAPGKDAKEEDDDMGIQEADASSASNYSRTSSSFFRNRNTSREMSDVSSVQLNFEGNDGPG